MGKLNVGLHEHNPYRKVHFGIGKFFDGISSGNGSVVGSAGFFAYKNCSFIILKFGGNDGRSRKTAAINEKIDFPFESIFLRFFDA